MIPAPAAVVLIALVALAVAVVIRRIRQADARGITHYQRVRTADQVMDDVRRWKADRRMRETRESLATCEAIYALPTVPQQRKETGQ